MHTAMLQEGLTMYDRTCCRHASDHGDTAWKHAELVQAPKNPCQQNDCLVPTTVASCIQILCLQASAACAAAHTMADNSTVTYRYNGMITQSFASTTQLNSLEFAMYGID